MSLDRSFEKYRCKLHGIEGDPDCKQCWDKFNQFVKDNNATLIGDLPKC